jgi:hypothetical protein
VFYNPGDKTDYPDEDALMSVVFSRRTGGLAATLLLPLALAMPGRSEEGGWTALSGGAKALESWKEPTGTWMIADEVGIDPQNPKRLAAKPGTKILVNGPTGNTKNLVSKQSFGDIELHLEFLVPQRSNSGVKFEGLYEIQIFDSWGVKTPTASDCGGIYPRAELEPKYHHIDKGVPPRTNASRPPGEWQTLDVIFLAPRFDAQGKKIANARFVKVVLNDTVIHENVELKTPTGHAWRDQEVPRGPLLFQADHGPVAFREIRVRPYRSEGKGSP